MFSLPSHTRNAFMSRRGFLQSLQFGLGATAATALLLEDKALFADEESGVPAEAADPAPHHLSRAKRVVHVVATGGFSQVDSFDYKPELSKFHGKTLVEGLGRDEQPDVFFGQVGRLRQSDFAFKQHGESGLWISDLFPHLATVADELTVVNSMFAETSNHTPATFQESTGFRLNGFPVFGSWVSYGLGAETQNLPSYVVFPDARSLPAGGSINWTNGFLPARHQGVIMRSQGTAIDDLDRPAGISDEQESATRNLLGRLNRRLQNEQGDDDVLTSRIKSYELAARMQRVVPEITDLGKESKETHAMYGLGDGETNDFGRACLLTRRLLENGVRFVQLFSGGAFQSPRVNWDGHEDNKKNHTREAGRVDQPLAALIKDLKQRGMLKDTVILFTSEFGRTPFTQSKAEEVGAGRDHNQNGFSVWMAGGAFKSGLAYGSTDPVGYAAVENPVHWNDLHATLLHALGIDHKRLTYYHNGIMRRLTNVGGEVVSDLLA